VHGCAIIYPKHWQQIFDFEGAAHPKDNIEALKEMTANLQKYSL